MKIFVKMVKDELKDLGMADSIFDCKLKNVTIPLSEPSLNLFGTDFYDSSKEAWQYIYEILSTHDERGAQRANFYLAANKGEDSQLLSKVASGGEASRIMLALKKTLVVDSDTRTLVFDEIDSGISGRIADMVGSKLKNLSDNFQVICISHSPQVVVYARNHLSIRKVNIHNRTDVHILNLDKKQRTDEIARLLSGIKVTKTSLDHAYNLLQNNFE